jgi:C-terminal processing protease CtpA/Prc
MLINNLSIGKYSQITKAGRLADSIKEDIHEVHFDLHSWVEANRRMLPYDSVAGPSDNFGFEKIEKMKGNVGYIKLNEFSPLSEAQVIAGNALDSVSNCKALIFDLRDNHGGYPQMIQFLSSQQK